MQSRGQHLRARDAGGAAADGRHHPARRAPAPGAHVKEPRRDALARRTVCGPRGAGARAEGVQRGGQEERVQADGDAAGGRALGGRVDAGERARHGGAENPAGKNRERVQGSDQRAFVFYASPALVSGNTDLLFTIYQAVYKH